jgi:hypothetical protein
MSHLTQLCGTEPVGRQLHEEPIHFADYLALLDAQAPVKNVWTGPAYSFPERLPPPRRIAVAVTSENVDVLRLNFPDWVPDINPSTPCLAILDHGHAVSVCASVRITPEAHEAGVETVADSRRRGYASDVVTQWANEVRRRKCAPLYSTSWKNDASIAVANRLRLRLYGSDFHVT